MWLQTWFLSSIFYICSAQQNMMMGRVFQNPFIMRVVRQDPMRPPPPGARSRSSASSPPSPCPGGCDPGYVCYGGGCQKMGDSLCNPMCEENHTCHHGHCHYEPCRPACRNGQRCINGRCENIPCRPRCQEGFVCNQGQCERDRGGDCMPSCPPGYRCHNGHCDLLNSNPHGTCDPPCPNGFTCRDSHCERHPTPSEDGVCDGHRPCVPPSRCVNGHCTGDALTVGLVSPTEVREVTGPNVPFIPSGPISPFVPSSQGGPFSSVIPNRQTNSIQPNDPNSRWLVRDSSGSRVPWARPIPTLIRPSGAIIPGNSQTGSSSSGSTNLNPFPNAADLFPMTGGANSLPLPGGQSNTGAGLPPIGGIGQTNMGGGIPPMGGLGQSNMGGGIPPISGVGQSSIGGGIPPIGRVGQSNIGGGMPPISGVGQSSIDGGLPPLSGLSNSGTGMSLPPLTAIGVQNPPAGPPAMPPQGPPQRPAPGGSGTGGLHIPDIAEICQGGNCQGAPLAPGSNVGLINQRPAAPQTRMVGRGDQCGELTCFENEFCFDRATSTCIGVNTGDPRVP